MANFEDREALKKDYQGLRAADEQLQDAQRDNTRLMAAKMVFFPGTFDSSHHLQDDQLFEGNDAEEWWGRAYGSGLFRSEASIERELESLNSRRKDLEDVESKFRCSINKISRPLLRDLHTTGFRGQGAGWEVEEIYNYRKLESGGLKFLINWKGGEETWAPFENERRQRHLTGYECPGLVALDIV